MKVHLAAGSYGHVLYGYDIDIDAEGDSATFIARYSYEAHIKGITALGLAGKTLVSGGADEFIKIYDLERQKEFGNLMEHTGTITCLEFYENTHLISAAEDGAIMVYETKNWECQRVMRGHTGAVDGLSIHPTGKLALSVGRDRTLHVWNLIKGRKAYATRLPKARSPARLVKWVPTGEAYAVALDDNLFIYATASGKLLRKIEIKAQIHSMAFFSDGSKVAVGAGAEDIKIVDINSGEIVHTIVKAHENRVRNVVVLDMEGMPAHMCVLSSSSDGYIKAWKVPANPEAGGGNTETHECIGSMKTSARLTCMVAQLHANKDRLAKVTIDAAAAAAALPPADPNTTKKAKKSKRAKRKAAAPAEDSDADDGDTATGGTGSADPAVLDPAAEDTGEGAAKPKRKRIRKHKDKTAVAKSAAAAAAAGEQGDGDDGTDEVRLATAPSEPAPETMSKKQLKKAKNKAMKQKNAEARAVFQVVVASNSAPVLPQPFDESSDDMDDFYDDDGSGDGDGGHGDNDDDGEPGKGDDVDDDMSDAEEVVAPVAKSGGKKTKKAKR